MQLEIKSFGDAKGRIRGAQTKFYALGLILQRFIKTCAYLQI